MDPGWRSSDFWKDIYPRWAEPIFKEGIDVKTNIVNDEKRFAVDIDAYQFKPEELQVNGFLTRHEIREGWMKMGPWNLGIQWICNPENFLLYVGIALALPYSI